MACWLLNCGICLTIRRMCVGMPKWRERPEDHNFNPLFMCRAYLLMGIAGLGYLALTWSTVVLLGGFVSTIGRKDFWCLTTISMIQAVRIFNDFEDNMFGGFSGAHLFVASKARHNGPIGVSFTAVVVSAVILLGSIYRYGHVICLVLSLWRIAQRDYGSKHGDVNLGNLVPALDLFYSMVICQCLLFVGWLLINLLQNDVHYNLHGTFQLTKIWGREAVWAYISDTRQRCWRNPASIRGRCFVHYAVDMLDSQVQNDYLTGARVLDHFIGLDADVSSLILPSRPRIQKLIDTLGWRSNDLEIRELAARIVAYIACDIHLTQFPGAMQSISSLLDITAIYWSKKTLQVDYSVEVINGNELILQGLTILQRLACNNQQNCRDICSNPDLLHKILAPIYSDTLMQDICIEQWLSTVNASFRVVLRLMQADEGTASLMRRDISSRALSNLEKILDNGDVAGTELHMAAICIMTELALDASINLSHEAKETLVNQQLQIFFADESNDITAELKVAAGKSIAAVSNNENISAYIIREYGDIVTRLTEMLDSTNKVVCRTIAAEILENLFTHCPCIRMKDTFLVQVISEVPTRKRKPRVLGNNEEIIKIGPDERDEKEKLPEHTAQTELSDQDRKEQLEFKAAYLSLALMLCNKMISANGIRGEDQLIVTEKGEFAANIKAILKENCRPTLFSMRIVKLSLQIAISVMQLHNHYTEHFKDEEFKSLLFEAMKILPSLESCVLFGGTDRRGNMAARPLLKDLVAEVLRLVSCPPYPGVYNLFEAHVV